MDPRLKALCRFAQGNHALHPPQQGMGIILLGFHIDGLVMVFRVDVDGEIESLGVGLGKAGVAVGAPLHGRTHPVPVSQKDIIPHADFIAVVEDRSPGHGKEEGFHQFDAAAVISQERRQAAANSQIDAGLGILGVNPVHVIPLLVGHHLQGKLVVVPQEEGPLADCRESAGSAAGCRRWESGPPCAGP